MRKGIVLLLIWGVALVAGVLWAHGGKPHVMGTVQAVDERHVEVKTQDGKVVSALLTKDTKYVRGKATALRSDLKVGQRVVVHLTGEGKDLTVTEVRLGSEQSDGESKESAGRD